MKYIVTYHVEGNVTVLAEADSEEEALELADPEPEHSGQAGGCWVPTRAGRSTWLAASA